MSNIAQTSSWQLPTSTAIISSREHNDASVLPLVHKILYDAVLNLASDIHFEPYATSYRIRFRVDGILREIQQPLQTMAGMAGRICSCIKILSHLDIAEKRLPQDGHFSLSFSQKSFDFRVSTCPTHYGEKVVVRILNFATDALAVDDLGLTLEQKTQFLNAIQRPDGLILVTGPTGSGKTATLYSALHLLNTKGVNIVTAEDPIEINIAGINQVNIHPKIGLSFTKVMRAFLRQDPDIIMLGEIRCKESAEIAISAAETGHLVLSTLHSQSAAYALARLQHMGLSAFDLADVLRLIVAQRLVRRLCDYCKLLEEEGVGEKEMFGISGRIDIYKADEAGCAHCFQGYLGRIAVFEVMPISAALIDLMLSDCHVLQIANQAKKDGVLTLYESAVEKIKMGLTSIAEVRRLISFTE
jgi:type IV pilus assembly protein PilB